MRVLMVGDVIGRPGRRAVRHLLPGLRQEYQIDLVIANGENTAGGFGLTMPTAQELFNAGVDVLTSGNHIWDQKEIIPYLDTDVPILRPLNYPPGVPGKGFLIWEGALIINTMGRTFMAPLDCPFRAVDRLLAELPEAPPVIIVDFHAEASSEKVAMGWYLDGKVSAVLGTHTHVPTSDAKILAKGTAHITDVGMTGPKNSIIGDEPQAVLKRFLTQMPGRLPVAEGTVIFSSVLVDIAEGGKARSILRIDREVE